MALEMFLKIDGVVGGTRNYQHKGWSDMLSWNWNLERVGDNAGGNQPCANMNQITVLKAIGKESAALLQLFAEQKKISTVEISAMPVVGKREASQKYLSIVMEDVRLCAMRTDGEADENFDGWGTFWTKFKSCHKSCTFCDQNLSIVTKYALKKPK